MKIALKVLLGSLAAALAWPAAAALNVFACEPEWAALAQELGGDKVSVFSAVTPLQDAGEALDEAAFGPYVQFLAAGGVDGLLALGTTGEGFLLPMEQRMRAAQLFVEAAGGRILVAVHCGAQSTWDTVELAAHAADLGADGIAVMAPPYFTLDAEELVELPIVTAVVVGRLVVERQARQPGTGNGPVVPADLEDNNTTVVNIWNPNNICNFQQGPGIPTGVCNPGEM